MFPQSCAVACSVEIFPKRQVNDVENIELLAVQWTNKWRADPTNQTARSQHALPSILTYLAPFLPPLCPLSCRLFAPTWTVLTSYHEDVLSHWNKGQVKSIKQWDSSSSNNNNENDNNNCRILQLSSAQRAVVGVAWAPISTNTLSCPLNRWKNVNISYALWRCRAEAAGSWRLQREERCLMIEGRGRGKKKRLLVKIFELLLFTQWAKLCRSAFSFSFSFLSSIFALQHLPRPATCDLRPSALATWWSYNIYLVYYVASWSKTSLQICWQLIFMTRHI